MMMMMMMMGYPLKPQGNNLRISSVLSGTPVHQLRCNRGVRLVLATFTMFDTVLYAKRRMMETLRRFAIAMIVEEGLEMWASEEHIARALEAVDDRIEDVLRGAALAAFSDAMGAKRPRTMALKNGYPEQVYYMCLTIQN